MKKSMYRIGTVLLCCLLVCMMIALVACKGEEPQAPCTSHTDANEDGKCDACGAAVEKDVCEDHIDTDGDNLCEICGELCVDPIGVTILLKDEKGNTMSGISLTLLFDGEEMLTTQTDEDGCVRADLLPGSYIVWFEGLADGWYVEGNMSAIEFSAEQLTHEFTAIDNNPDGSEEKPFYVGDEVVELSMATGTTYHCFARGTSTRYLIVEGAAAKVVYEGNEYLPENGVIRVLVKGAEDTNSTMPFTVTNIGSTECVVTIRFESLPGTQNNPYRAELGETLTAEVPAEDAVYYTYTATSSGYLVMLCTTPDNNIMMYNTTTYLVTSYTEGGTCLYLPVNVGDEIFITVSSKGTADVNTVSFYLDMYSGEEGDPILAFASNAAMRMDASATLWLEFRVQERVTVSIDVSSGLTVMVNGVAVEPAGGACIFEAVMGTKVQVINQTQERTDIVLIVSQ